MENVYPFKPRLVHRPPQTRGGASAFDNLTDHLIMEQAKAGTLNPAVVEALLAAVRRPGRECSR